MTVPCPAGMSDCSRRARSSSTIWVKRCGLSKLVSVRTSAMSENRSSALSAVALPPRQSLATGIRVPRMVATRGAASMPPVLEASRVPSSTKSRLEVPISVRLRPMSGTRGRSSVGTASSGKRISAYRMPDVSMSWARMARSPALPSSLGRITFSRGRSARVRLGMAARASGLSGACWLARRASVQATISLWSSSERAS